MTREEILNGADLTGADLPGADLSWADLTRADLSWADLTRADLTRANLTGADLTGARLTGAKILDDTVISLVARTTRSDGHEFFLFKTLGGEILRAGCQTRSLASYWRHVNVDYPAGDRRIKETSDILTFFAKRLEN